MVETAPTPSGLAVHFQPIMDSEGDDGDQQTLASKKQRPSVGGAVEGLRPPNADLKAALES